MVIRDKAPLDILALLDEIQSIGRNGLTYARDPFDRERYRRLVELASLHYGHHLGVAPRELRERWSREIGQITPKVGAEAAVFDALGRILVTRRSDDGLWGLPGGWLEPNESPAEAAERETCEETGLVVRVSGLVGVFTRHAHAGVAPQSTVAVVYLCDVVGGVRRGSHESTAVDFLPVDEVPAWHGWHAEHAEAAYRLWRSRRGAF